MLASQTSSGGDPIHSLLNAISHKLVDFPVALRNQIEDDLQSIRSYVDQGAAAESAARHSELAESINDGFVELDRDWRFIYVNQRAANNVGYSRVDLVGKNMWELFPSLLGTPSEQVFRQVMEQRQPASFETVGTITDKWYNNRVYPSNEGITIFWIDITERKQAEKALRESEARLRRIAQAGRVGFVEWNASKDSAYWNAEHYELFGFEPGSPISWQRWAQGVHPDDRERVFENSARLLERGRSEGQVHGHKDEYRFIREDGSMVWIESDISVEMVGSEQIVRGVVRDITERKQSEEMLRYHASLVDNIPEAALSTDASFHILSWNQGAEKMYGWKANEVLGKPVSLFLQTEYLDHTTSADAAQQLFGQGQWKGEVIQRRKDGSQFYVSASLVLLKDGAGNNNGTFAVNHDITERKRAEEALKKANNDLTIERNRLLAIMEALPIGVSILDQNGGVIRTNKGFDEVWGGSLPPTHSVDDFEAYQAWWVDSGLPLKPEEWAAAQAVQKGETVTGQFLQIQRFDGRQAFVLNSGAPIRNANGEIVGSTVAIFDITQLIEAENALRESQDRFRVAVNTAPILVYTCDLELRYTWIYNPLRGFRAEDVLGKRDDEVLPSEAAAELIAAKRKALDTGQGGMQEVKVPLNDEDTYYLLATDPIRDAYGNVTGLTCSAIDITDQKRLQAQQQEQAIQIEVQQRLSEQREQDRYAIARDLHDGPIQTLSGSMFQLHMIKEVFPDLALEKELSQLGEDIKGAIQELRDLLNELRPPALIQFGFSKVARMLIEDFRERYPGIEIELEVVEEDTLLSKDTHLTLFRIFQAGINNIVRHSDAGKAWVVFKIEQDCFLLEIRDNGKGFELPKDYSQLPRHGHYGLVGMKERSEVIGASFSVSTAPGEGTRIMVNGPCSGKNLR
jgi:PAS domain S-box-containing protein